MRLKRNYSLVNNEGQNKAARWGAALSERQLLVAVVADGFHRAAFEGLHAQRGVLFGRGLVVDKRVAALFLAFEERGRRLAAKIAINALLIDVKFTADV